MKCDTSFNHLQMLKLYVQTDAPFTFHFEVSSAGIILSNDSLGWALLLELDSQEWEWFFNSSNQESALKSIVKKFIDSNYHESEEPQMNEIPGIKNVPVYDDEFFKIGKAYHCILKEVDDDHSQYNGLETDIIIQSFDRYRHNMTIQWVDYDGNNHATFRLEIPVTWYISKRVIIEPLSISKEE